MYSKLEQLWQEYFRGLVIFCFIIILSSIFTQSAFAEEKYVWAYQGDVAFFEENGYVGLQNRDGEILLPASYDAPGVGGGVFGAHDLAEIRLGNQRGLINRKGEIVVPLTRADYMGFLTYFSQGNRYFSDEAITYFYSTLSDAKTGFYTLEGKKIGNQLWDDALSFINGTAFVQKNDRWNLMDINGSLLSEVWWDDVKLNPIEGGGTVTSGNSVFEIEAVGKVQREYVRGDDGQLALLTLYDEGGDSVDFSPWDDVRTFCGTIKKVKLDGLWSLIDENGNVINGLEKCEQIGELIHRWGDEHQSVAYVTQGEKHGLIDSAGNYLLQLSGDVVGWLEPNRMLIRMDDGKHIIIDISGKIVKEIVGNRSNKGSTRLAFAVKKVIHFREKAENGDILEWGFMDSEGNILCSVPGSSYALDPEERLTNELIRIKYQGQPAYMDVYGNIITSKEWDENYWFSEGLAFVHTKNGYVIIDEEGRPLSQAREWKSVDEFYWEGDQLVARVRGGEGAYGSPGYVNDKGEPLCGVK